MADCDLLKIISRAQASAAGLKRYFTGAACIHGHFDERLVSSQACVACHNENCRKNKKTEQAKQRRRASRKRECARAAAREYSTRPERRAANILSQKKYHESEKGRAWLRRYWRARSAARKTCPKFQEWYNQWRKNKFANDLNYKLSGVIRARLHNAMKGRAKTGSAIKMLGCTLDEFQAYLAERFEPGMTWSNWGKGADGAMEWHLDHVRPLASFDLADPKQLAAACHHTNLQPLWAVENVRKGARLQ